MLICLSFGDGEAWAYSASTSYLAYGYSHDHWDHDPCASCVGPYAGPHWLVFSLLFDEPAMRAALSWFQLLIKEALDVRASDSNS
jgi:hypothetical protein